jgi:tetratricopeptide (TPR) repeat protein
VDSLYNATDENFRIFLLPMVKLVLELDKNNESGLLGKYIMVNAETEALTAYSQGDTEAAIKKYLEVADNKFVKNEDKQECFYTAAYLAAYSGSEDYQGIITYLQTAYELSPDSAKAPAIKDAITYFQTVIEKKDEFNLENEVDAK